MLIENISALTAAVSAKDSDFEVGKEAFDICDEVRQSQISGSGTDWSIAVTYGWMAIITNFNHSIHRAFMSQEKKNREDLRHILATKYIIKKTAAADKYQLVLRNKKVQKSQS